MSSTPTLEVHHDFLFMFRSTTFSFPFHFHHFYLDSLNIFSTVFDLLSLFLSLSLHLPFFLFEPLFFWYVSFSVSSLPFFLCLSLSLCLSLHVFFRYLCLSLSLDLLFSISPVVSTFRARFTNFSPHSHYILRYLFYCAGECNFRLIADSQGGRTALMYAASHGNADCVRLLIDAGADKEVKGNVRAGSLLCWEPLLLCFRGCFVFGFISPVPNRSIFRQVYLPTLL